jgi:hypothetical protein
MKIAQLVSQGRALDGDGDHMLDALAADEQMSDSVGAQDAIEIGALENCHDKLA